MDLPTHQKLAIIITLLVLTLLSFYPESIPLSVAFVSSLILFGFLVWNDREKNSSHKNLEDEIGKIKDRLDALSFKKAMGR